MPIEQRAAADAAGVDGRAHVGGLADRQDAADAGACALQDDVAIVADGELQSLPFAVFDDAATTRVYAYLPSIGTLRGLRALRAPAALAEGVAIIRRSRVPRRRRATWRHADESARGSADTLVLRAASEAGIANLPRLPHTRDEAKAIAALAERQRARGLALDFAANRAAAIGADVERLRHRAFRDARAAQCAASGVVRASCCRCMTRTVAPRMVSCASTTSTICTCRPISSCSASANRRSARASAAKARRISRARFSMRARRASSRASGRSTIARASRSCVRFTPRCCERGHRSAAGTRRGAEARCAPDPRWQAPYYWSGYMLEGDWR